MTPPFPWSLSRRAALRQAAGLLLLFYGVVYGGGVLLPLTPLRHGSPLWSPLLLGLLMLSRSDPASGATSRGAAHSAWVASRSGPWWAGACSASSGPMP